MYITIDCINSDVTDSLIKDYWTAVINELSDMAPPLRDRLVQQQPEFNGQMIQLTCAQEIEYRSFKNKYTEQLATTYETFGFPRLPFDFKLVEDTEALADAQVAFLEQRKIRRRRDR